MVVTSNATVVNNTTVDAISNADPLTIHNIKVETLPVVNPAVSEKQSSIAVDSASGPVSGNIIVTAELCDPNLQPITVQPIVQGPLVQPQVAVQAEQLTSISTLQSESSSTVANSTSTSITLESGTQQPVSLPSITVQPIGGDFVRPVPTEPNSTTASTESSAAAEDVPAKKARIEQSASVNPLTESAGNSSIDLPIVPDHLVDKQSTPEYVSPETEMNVDPVLTKSETLNESIQSTVKES